MLANEDMRRSIKQHLSIGGTIESMSQIDLPAFNLDLVFIIVRFVAHCDRNIRRQQRLLPEETRILERLHVRQVAQALKPEVRQEGFGGHQRVG
ncbi:Hypothetical protein NGAL_HAMBI2566_56150 [Neorhizobium galegae bv. orientalis]|nr:Hypothetical protein NGAL_HAMBI2566_56150 [Neorhizobium galegae bv. orientalis]